MLASVVAEPTWKSTKYKQGNDGNCVKKYSQSSLFSSQKLVSGHIMALFFSKNNTHTMYTLHTHVFINVLLNIHGT